MDWLQTVVAFAQKWVIDIGIPVGDEVIPLMVVLLLGTGFYLTVRTGFVQLSRLGHGFGVTSGKYDDPDDPGDVSHFQALTTALSATVGIGNIAGVAMAIHWGGPGALFWMWVTAFVGMATKFSEVTLAQKYRVVDEFGKVAGGPMYYIEKGLGPRWKPMAIFFAVMLGFTAFLTGNAVQAQTVADSMFDAFRIPRMYTGFFTVTVVAAVVLGGIGRIGKVTAFLTPIMAAIYVFGALVIIVLWLVVLGVGIGIWQSPNNSTILGSVPRDRLGTAAATIVTSRQVGQAISIAIGGALFSARSGAFADARSSLGIDDPLVTAPALLAGLELAFLVAAGIALLAAIVTWLGIGGPAIVRRSGQRENPVVR